MTERMLPDIVDAYSPVYDGRFSAKEKPQKLTPIPHPKTLEFLNLTITLGIYQKLDEPTRQLIESYYYSPGVGFKDLRDRVHPKTGKAVKMSIFGALEKMWNELPKEAKEELPQNIVIKPKHQSYTETNRERMRRGPSDETRRKISEHAKQVGFSKLAEERRLAAIKDVPRPEPVRIAIANGVKAFWNNPGSREIMLRGIREERYDDRSLWAEAQKNNLVPLIIKNNLLTHTELDTLKSYFSRKIRKNRRIENLIEKFSIAVAKVA
jgi:hypothetical protein